MKIANDIYFYRMTNILVITGNTDISSWRVYSSITANWLRAREHSLGAVSRRIVTCRKDWCSTDLTNVFHWWPCSRNPRAFTNIRSRVSMPRHVGSTRKSIALNVNYSVPGMRASPCPQEGEHPIDEFCRAEVT